MFVELEKEIRSYYQGSEEKLEAIIDYFGEMLQNKEPYKVFCLASSIIGVHGVFVKGLIRMAHRRIK